MEITQCQHQKGKMSQKFDDSLMHLVDNIKHTNIPTIGIHGEEREKDINFLEETMAENFPNPVKETDIQVQEAQRHGILWRKP